MTAEEIRADIAASPEMLALVPDTFALAEALSQGRTKLVPTEIGNGTILEAIGLSAGNALLDVINTAPDFRHVKPLIEQGRLRLDSALVLGTLQSLVDATVITQAHADALVARATVPDPVTEYEVRAAIRSADGVLLVGGQP